MEVHHPQFLVTATVISIDQYRPLVPWGGQSRLCRPSTTDARKTRKLLAAYHGRDHGIAQRPVIFYRGYDVYDRGNVSSGDDAARTGRLFDTRLPGNGNQGDLFGKALNDEEKAAFSNT